MPIRCLDDPNEDQLQNQRAGICRLKNQHDQGRDTGPHRLHESEYAHPAVCKLDFLENPNEHDRSRTGENPGSAITHHT